jgi:hypothetical protein
LQKQVQRQTGFGGTGFTGCGKSGLFCHSERSEESLRGLSPRKKERFLASLGMTKWWRGFFRSLFSLSSFEFLKVKAHRLKPAPLKT